MRVKMSSTSNCCPGVRVASVLTCVLTVVGIVAIGCALFSRMQRENVDPLSEADRRIDELEQSLHRLQETYGKASH